MNPKLLNSPYAEYLQTLMHRKIQNPQMIVPYILKSKQLKRIREKHYTMNKIPRMIKPKNLDPYHNPRPFGMSLE